MIDIHNSMKFLPSSFPPIYGKRNREGIEFVSETGRRREKERKKEIESPVTGCKCFGRFSPSPSSRLWRGSFLPDASHRADSIAGLKPYTATAADTPRGSSRRGKRGGKLVPYVLGKRFSPMTRSRAPQPRHPLNRLSLSLSLSFPSSFRSFRHQKIQKKANQGSCSKIGEDYIRTKFWWKSMISDEFIANTPGK